MTTYQDILILKDKVSEPLKTMSKNSAKFSKDSLACSESVNKLNQKITNLARAFVSFQAIKAGAQALINLGKNAMETADKIDKMSQKIGMSADAYQKWNYIMQINGGSVDSLQAGFKSLTTQIDGVRKGSKDSLATFKALGITVKNNDGTFRSQEAIFDDVIRSLQNCKNETQRTIYANKLFGRSAAELKPLLNQNSADIDELSAEYEKLGLGISKDVIKRGVELKDNITKIQSGFSALSTVIVGEAFPALNKFTSTIIDNMPAVRQTTTDAISEIIEVCKFLSENIETVKNILIVLL